ncbi:MAG: outer rane efflux protein, partial [Bryobacterales bacterium]|nr:outer rane efflux protein [Bryobacterales bacterium]
MKRVLCLAVLLAPTLPAQSISSWNVARWYETPEVRVPRDTNSPRLDGLIRSGQLRLTLADAIALAIENNLNLEAARYGPLLSEWALKRAEAGGPVRGVPSASAQVSSVNSGVGVNGSTASAGLGSGGGNGANGSGGGASIQQIGAVTPNLDPIVQNTTTFSHLSAPLANTIVSGTTALVQSTHTYTTTYRQGLLSGGYFQLLSYQQSLNENAPTNALNPASGPHIDFIFRHSLLAGYGRRLNSRGIRIAELNVQGARYTFRLQVSNLVARVVTLYWDLVAGNDLVRMRQAAVDVAQKFVGDTQSRIDAGALARVELPRAAAELAARSQDLLLAQTSLRQQETLFKEALSRAPDPALDAAGIVPLDTINVPQTDEVPALRDLLAEAQKNRPEVALGLLQKRARDISAIGTENPLLPSLQVQALAYNRGVAGTPQPSGGPVSPYFVGGYGTALGQIFRRDFPSQTLSVSLSATLRNREDQADYGIEQLQMRQSDLRDKRDANQLVVDVSNQSIALRQARSRYSAAVNTRRLEEQLLKSE